MSIGPGTAQHMQHVRDEAARLADMRAQERHQGDPLAVGGGIDGGWYRVLDQPASEDDGDCVLARAWDWETDDFIVDSEEVYIAKPPKLRRSSYLGKTIDGIQFSASGQDQRTTINVATGRGQVEVIYPPYLHDDDDDDDTDPTIIWAVEVGATGAKAHLTDDSFVTLQDANLDGRGWVQRRCGI